MNARNCPRCGKVFTSHKNICQNCEKIEEESFKVLKAYIVENQNSTVGEVSDATGVSVRRITQYVRDGLLDISTGFAGDISCEKCGKPIRTGRYCESCALGLSAKINEVFGREVKLEPRKEDGTAAHQRMHTLGKAKKL